MIKVDQSLEDIFMVSKLTPRRDLFHHTSFKSLRFTESATNFGWYGLSSCRETAFAVICSIKFQS